MKTPKLYTAGPVPVPEFVQSELKKALIFHREDEFKSLYQIMISGLQYVLHTENDVLAFPASGTGAMEAAVSNLLSAGDSVLVIEQGKFSSRWSEICETFGVGVVKIVLPWRVSIEPELVKKALLSNENIRAVLMPQCETSTGALNDIAELSHVVHRYSEAVLVVDGISSIGAIPFEMDSWDVDVAVFSSNKGMMNPPGLAFISLNDRAWKMVYSASLPCYYFDLTRMRKAQTSGIGPVFTPAIPIVRGVNASVGYMRKMTIRKLWARTSSLANAFRTAIQSLGLAIWPPQPSDALTVIGIPDSLDASEIQYGLKTKHHMILSGGQGELKGRVLRIGHYCDRPADDYSELLSALESVLIDMNWNIKKNMSVKLFIQSMNSQRIGDV
ncbi:MAG: alanine--glyoxylate aminotransferase family protein [candidate division KSB1 bacterium]|jgi:aspartate aminotransferase-like enzyme|nr:alanine--glyoxylate aminotransferase family protein [candidate division KSB1 bacterium]